MDINKLRPVPISTYAREKVILDFFPDVANEIDIISNEQNLNAKEAPLHAGALCLYATTLITKLHETSPFELQPYYKEREAHLKSLIKSHPKYVHLTDDEVSNFVKNIIAKDIRNSFAHGNFEISYDIYTKKLYFVLKPHRYDFVCPEPIVISKQALIDANKKFFNEHRASSALLAYSMLQNNMDLKLNSTIKSFMLPTQILKLAEYYIGTNKTPNKNDVLFNDKLYYLIDYVLLASKMTYEQNDYYNLFGKSSNVFDTISLIRNSIAHDNYEFEDNAYKVNYKDEARTKSETVGESAVKLLIVDTQKNILKSLKEENYSLESVSNLTEKFKEIFDFFFGGKYDIKDIVNAMVEIKEEGLETLGR